MTLSETLDVVAVGEDGRTEHLRGTCLSCSILFEQGLDVLRQYSSIRCTTVEVMTRVVSDHSD